MISAKGDAAAKKLAQLKKKFAFLETVEHQQTRATESAEQRFSLDAGKLNAEIESSKAKIKSLKEKAAASVTQLTKLTKEHEATEQARAAAQVGQLARLISY